VYFIQENAKVNANAKEAEAATLPVDSVAKGILPAPVLPGGKEFPKAKYTGVHFSETISDYENLHLKDVVGAGEEEECFVNADGRKQCIIDRTQNFTLADFSNNADGGDEDEHLPAGQHLLIDIKNVDSAFLDSEMRLAQAMLDVVNESKLTLLSYHCHKLMPMGVTCVGVLLESHISFHTWPEAGVITLDLFTCGSGKLVPVVPIVERLFAVPEAELLANLKEGESLPVELEPSTRWTHKFRGFRKWNQWGNLGYLTSDLGDLVLESTEYDYKKEITFAQTPFQRIDIYDTIGRHMDHDAYLRSLKDDGSYEATHKEFYRPQRRVFLDGVLQSTRQGLEAYHEALVQPVMFAHEYPRRVAIIGGGEGATLREVLKHKSIDVVKMIEIDEMMVDVSRKHIPEWNDCSDFIGSDVIWCGDDKRAEMYYEDAIGWFKDNFGSDDDTFGEVDEEEEEDNENFEEEKPFDILIMDALDPQDEIPFASLLYSDPSFVRALYESLSDDGIMVLQLGGAPFHEDPADQFTMSARRTSLIKHLEDAGFESMHIYEDGNCGFMSAWTFLVVMKNSIHRENWYQTAAELDVEIHSRILRTHSGEPALQYFDAAVMSTYVHPHKVFETVYCRARPQPESCVAMEMMSQPKVENASLDKFEVRLSGAGEKSGRGIYAKVDVAKGTTIARREASRPVFIHPSSLWRIFDYMEMSSDINDVWKYVDGYGWQTDTLGPYTYHVDKSIMTFVNHGCKGDFNTDDMALAQSFNPDTVLNEQTATADDKPENRKPFDPFTDRHSAIQKDVALRDIKAGEEITCNYMYFTSEEDWFYEVETLKNMCNGVDVGLITKAETEFRMRKRYNQTASEVSEGCTTCDRNEL